MLPKLDKFMNTAARVITAIFFAFFILILTMTSLTGTTAVEIISGNGVRDTIVQHLREGKESIIFYSDNIISNLIWLAVFIVAAAVIVRLSSKLDGKKFPLWLEISLLCAWTIFWGFMWVHTSQLSPTDDSYAVMNASLRAAKDNYGFLEESRYFQYYRFQLGYVLFNEGLIRAAQSFGEVKTLLFLQDISVIMLASAYAALLLSAKRIFKDRRVIHIMTVLLALTMQPVMTCSFLYGLVPGLVFGVWAVYLEIITIQSETWKGKIVAGALSALFVTLAVVIKSNNLIILVAMGIYAVVNVFRDKKSFVCLCAVIAGLIGSVAVPEAIARSYEDRADKNLGDSIPFVSWFAMGMQEGPNAPGWYNYGATMANFENANFDADLAAERSVEEIKKRMEVFNEDKQYRNDFFFKKFTSMWNETSYESIWNNQVRAQYKEKTGLAKWACGKGEKKLKRFMDLLAQFVFVSSLAAVVYCLKTKNTLAFFPALITVGGILYHLLAEAKSQYAIPYYVWITAFAAVGAVYMADRITPLAEAKIKSIIRKEPVENDEKKAPVKSKRMKKRGK